MVIKHKHYGSWEVDENGVVSNGDISIDTKNSDKFIAVGDYGNKYDYHNTAISGICLLDATWSVQFSTGGIRSIALPLDRQRVCNRISNRGFEVTKVIFPTELSMYHTKLIEFVSDSIVELQLYKLLYHIPTDEYKMYVATLEKIIGKSIPGAYDIIDMFSDKIKKYFIAKMNELGFSSFEVINSMQNGITDPEQSYLSPYVNPTAFGATEKNIYAIEDLVELKIAFEAEKICGYKVPVHFCVLDIPHPYTRFSKKNILTRDDVCVVSV